MASPLGDASQYFSNPVHHKLQIVVAAGCKTAYMSNALIVQCCRAVTAATGAMMLQCLRSNTQNETSYYPEETKLLSLLPLSFGQRVFYIEASKEVCSV